MALSPLYKIHPAIGVARVGTSATEFFIGPEYPGRPPEGDPGIGSKVPPFKSAGAIKRQAARFRIWKYTDNGAGKYQAAGEMNLDSGEIEWIQWTVHLANKKAAFFQFNGLLGDPVYGPPAPPVRRLPAPPDLKELWLDPGPRTIKGRSISGVQFKKGSSRGPEYWPKTPPTPPIEYLGELRTDDKGRLIVLGGFGAASTVGASPITTYANNPGWFDDVSDGPVTATIKIKGNARPIQAVGAWVLVAPPAFAPAAQNITTLYDTLFDLAAREMTLPANDAKYDTVLVSLRNINRELKGKPWGKVSLTTYQPSFEEDIWPTLRRAIAVDWLFKASQYAHVTVGAVGQLATMYPVLSSPAGPQAVRSALFGRLHVPGLLHGGPGNTNMPRMLGDDPYPPPTGWGVSARLRHVVTPTQYALFDQWVKGKFTSARAAPPPIPPAGPVTPEGLDKAALENCVGGPFFPGIEVSWQIRHSALYLEPFRIKQGAPSQYKGDVGVRVDAGHFSRQMAQPWQADFLMCRTERPDALDWAWWPAARPHDIYESEADAKALLAGASPAPTMKPWARSTVGGVPGPWGSGGVEPIYAEMIASSNWAKFGFVIAKGDVMFESERGPDVP